MHKGIEAKVKIERESRKPIGDLIQAGFELVSISGSHHKYRKGLVSVIVPHPKKDLPPGTARAIYKKAGLIGKEH